MASKLSQDQFVKKANMVHNNFYDYSESNYNLLIEFDGEQHHNKNSKWYTKRGINRDHKKNRYAQKNNINLLRIKYTKIKQIDSILIDYLHLYS